MAVTTVILGTRPPLPGALVLLGPRPHLPPLPFEPPHTLLPPLGSHDFGLYLSEMSEAQELVG